MPSLCHHTSGNCRAATLMRAHPPTLTSAEASACNGVHNRRRRPDATTVHERSEMYVAEFTLQAKPGHYAEVAALYSAFAADFLSDHPALEAS
jgi:hypothetical protein